MAWPREGFSLPSIINANNAKRTCRVESFKWDRLPGSPFASFLACALACCCAVLQLTCVGGIYCGLYIDQVMVADAYAANPSARSGCVRLAPNTTHDITLRFFAAPGVLASNETKVLLRWVPCAAPSSADLSVQTHIVNPWLWNPDTSPGGK